MLIGGDLIHQWMLGRQHHITGTEQCVGPGGEDRDSVRGGPCSPFDMQRESNLRALGSSDPVGLHGANPFGPALQLIQIIKKRIGVIRDFQEPLAQKTLLNHSS